MPETIGFIGLGVMGKPMAGHLIKAGYPLVVHNRSRGPAPFALAPQLTSMRPADEDNAPYLAAFVASS